MPATDREIWETISTHAGTASELNYLTYAIYAFEKYDWVRDFEIREGKAPTTSEIDQWISQITDHRIATWRETAARLFDAAAKVYMTPEIDRQKKDAVDQSILRELKRANVWWKQIGVALITAILAPLIIGAVIVAARSYDLFMPTATDMSKKLQTPLAPERHEPAIPKKPE